MTKKFLLIVLAFSINLHFWAQDSRKYTTHVVKQGETLKSIAKLYDCKVKDLKNLNPDIKEDKLPVNSNLVVPNNKKSEIKEITVSNDQNIHTVESGETLYWIAKKYSVTISELKKINNLTGDNISPGQKLKIPTNKSSNPTFGKISIYQVQKGDTKWNLASKYHITIDQLIALNPILKDTELKSGQSIFVPEIKENVTPIEKDKKDSKEEREKKEPKEEQPISEKDSRYIYHTVKQGEGIYRIAQMYGTTQEEIEKLNPEETKQLIPGMVLKILRTKLDGFLTHEVEKGDTVFGLSQKYNVSEEYLLQLNPDLIDGLKVGSTIRIKPEERESGFSENLFSNKKHTLNISFLMPLQSDSIYEFGRDTKESKLLTIVTDFYMGAQMAIDEFEAKGYTINHHVYDTQKSNSNIKQVIDNKDIKDSDLIIGPFFLDRAEIVADEFRNTPVILPLYSKKQDDNHQKNLIKVGQDKAYYGQALGNYLVKNYKKQNIVLIWDNTAQNMDDAETIGQLFKENNITFKTVKPTSNTSNPEVLYLQKGSLLNALSKTEDNWVILLSDNKSVNSEVINTLGLYDTNPVRLFTNGEFEKISQVNFGYLIKLKWTYTTSQFDDLRTSEVETFRNKYREINKSFPGAYSYTGYDLTKDILSKYTSGNFIKNLENDKTRGMSHKYEYIKRPEGDYVNTGVLLIKLNSNYEYELVE